VREILGKLLCRIGWHKWKYIGSSLFLERAYMCVRPYCRVCKQDTYSGTILFQREEHLEGDK
jgi:hypothetical protein